MAPQALKPDQERAALLFVDSRKRVGFTEPRRAHAPVRFAAVAARSRYPDWGALSDLPEPRQIGEMAQLRSLRPALRLRPGALPDDLHGYAREPSRRAGRPPKHEFARWLVVDDWPERVPVTTAEVEVFEAWFGDTLDELFGP